MRKLNCWEIMKCGREPRGYMVDDLGVCPAASAEDCTGINNGKNAGRICWAVAGTFCKGKVQGCLALTLSTCMICEVYERVRREENNENFFLLKARNPCRSSH